MPRFPTKEERAEKLAALEAKIADKKGVGAVYGLVKGLSITMKTMLKPAITQQYPHVKPDLPPRTRGVIALKEENCTVCMLCSRECPDWCIYIDAHKEVPPPKRPGERARPRNMLDRFAIDYALCMYCGICVEVCPFDALFWSPHFEYSTADITELTHEMDTLGGWMEMVMPPPPLDPGAEQPAEVLAEAAIYGLNVGEPGAVATMAPPAPAPAQTDAAPAPTVTDEVPVEAAPSAVQHDAEPPQIDQEAFDAAMAAGKSEREARALAKKAWILKRRKGGA